jgi:uncharacterized protein YjaG (DUF416 family)
MSLIRYDEQWLVRQLRQLPPELCVAFAAACAERLLPAYFSFAKQTGRGDPRRLAAILERLWADLQGNPMSAEELKASLDTCMSLIPQEDEEPWVEEQAYAEDAVVSLAYALRARQSGESQEAAWAARVAYETVDHYVINRVGIDTNQPSGEERVLSHGIVQAELARQRRDVEELLNAVGDANTKAVVSAFHARARADAIRFFQSDEL